MLDFLAQGLIVTAAMFVAATLLLFLAPAVGRTPLSAGVAIVGGMGVALLSLIPARLLGVSPADATVVALLLGASVVAWLPLGRSWSPWGLLAWAMSVDVGLVYLAYILLWSVSGSLGVWATTASLLLWVLELFVFLIGVGYVWELIDVVARRSWTASPEAHGMGATAPDGTVVRRPFVSLHVPAHNEPPEMVIETLEQLLLLDYDDYEVLVVDNNTTDPTLWRPLEDFCALHERLVFIHLENWPGFKSGALNYALTRTDPRAEIIGIVDADYHVDPDFLAHCAPLFNDTSVSFVQTPQDYRDWKVSAYFRRLYYSYGYFFDVSQRSRNERNGAIFGGTMGLIRRAQLEELGGWDEWCITEDAELSLRLLRAGGRGLHIDRAYGRGVMPLTFETLKGQRFRWCFGGIQILRLHWRSLLPGRRTTENQLTPAQRWAYFVGGLQWFGDLAALVFTGFLLLGAIDAVAGNGLVVRRLSGLLLVSLVTLVVVGAARSVALVKRSSTATWGEAAGAFGIWLGLGLTVARACWLGLVSREGTFLRTPKVKGDPTALDALRGNKVETFLALLCVAVAAVALAAPTHGSAAVGGLLVLQALGFAMAPLNSLAAIRSDLTDDQRRRRVWLAGATPTDVRRGGVVLATAVLALAGFVALAAPANSPLSAASGGLVDRVPALSKTDDESPGNGPSSPSPQPTDSSPPTSPPTSVDVAVVPPTSGPSTGGQTSAPSSAPPGAGTATAPGASSSTPSNAPAGSPSSLPTPTTAPSGSPTTRPTQSPTTRPTGSPTTQPSPPAQSPTSRPTGSPTRTPR